MSDQLLMTVLFLGLLYGLIFTKWAAEWVFVCIMLAAYFAGLVSTEEVLDKASNSGVMTLVILLLVSTGIEKVSWLTQMSDKLIVPSYSGTLLRMGSVTAVFSAFVNNTAVVASLAHTVRNTAFWRMRQAPGSASGSSSRSARPRQCSGWRRYC